MKNKHETLDKACIIVALVIGVICAAKGFTLFETIAVLFLCVIAEMMLRRLLDD